MPRAKALRLVKGSHIVVRKLFDHDHAYIFQNPDKRIIFAIPYEGDFTLIGTTDVEHHGPIGEARIDDGEIAYLCEQASRYFAQAGRARRRGVELLPACGRCSTTMRATRRPSRATTCSTSTTTQAPLLTVWGGKITTFRKLAEEAADLLAPMRVRAWRARAAWTREARRCRAAT